VAVAAVADHVDDHVLAELAAEVEREAGGEYHRLGVVAVHVEDRRLHHLGHVRAVEGGAGVEGVGGGEADLVVDDDVDRAAGGVAPGLGQVQRLHHHALSGEGRVAVDQERQDLLALAVAAPLLAGAHRPLDDGADDLEMGGVEAERHVHVARRRGDVGGVALVVLDVARHLSRLHVHLALELLEQQGGRLAQQVDQHVEAAPVGHADDDLLDALGAGALHQLVEHGHQGLAALEREALLAHVAGVQVALHALGGGEHGQDPALALRGDGRTAAVALEPLLDPALLAGVGDVHVLRADAAGVDLVDQAVDLAQGQAVGGVQGARVEDVVHVLLGEVVVGQVEVRHHRPLAQVERVEVGGLVPPVAVGVDQPQHRRLLLGGHRRHPLRGAHPDLEPPLPREAHEVLLDRPVGHLVGRLPVHDVESLPPLGRHRRGVLKVAFVEVFDEGGVAAVEAGGELELFDERAHCHSLKVVWGGINFFLSGNVSTTKR